MADRTLYRPTPVEGFCVGCAIYVQDVGGHALNCRIGQMEERDRRITELEQEVASLRGVVVALAARSNEPVPPSLYRRAT